MRNQNNKMEIKIQSKSSYYYDIAKQKIISIIKPLGIILLFLLALYIGFYVLLFFILFYGLSYLFKVIFKR